MVLKEKDNFPEIVAALHEKMAPYLRQTLLLHSNYYSRKLGANVYFKLENIQATGSFKARGALSKALSLTDDERKKGFIAASAGNHGLGVCFAAQKFGTRAKIFMPKATPDFKVRKIVEWGGEPVLQGDQVAECFEFAKQEAEKTGAIFFHPFDDEDVMRGQATIAHEILQELPNADMIVCSIGGGGLIAGIARYAKAINPNIEIHGIETLGSESMSLALSEGEPAALSEVNTVAESIAVRQVGALPFAHVKDILNGVHIVEDEEALHAQIDILQQIKMLTEPAASCTLSALQKGLIPNFKGKNIVLLMCGGNYPVEKLALTIQRDADTIFKTTRETLHRQLQQFDIVVDEKDTKFDQFYRDIKRREADGYAYGEAPASLELFALKTFGQIPDYFDFQSFRVLEERIVNGAEISDLSEARVHLTLKSELRTDKADSAQGPVSALDKAIRKILLPTYPTLNNVQLTDYRVRILTPHDGTDAVTRVMIESKDDQGAVWRTIGISADVIGASYHALQDSYLYKLLKDRVL